MTKLDRISPDKLRGNPRATFPAWLKYESLITSAFRMFPKPYVYRPASMSAGTVASRVRDALRGKLAFDWPSTSENAPSTSELLEWYSHIIIKQDEEQVYIGQPDEAQETLVGATPESSTELKFKTLDFEEVSAFQLLLSKGRIVGPVHILNPPDLTLLPQRPNSEIVNVPAGGILLI